jgi:manganese transport protein
MPLGDRQHIAVAVARWPARAWEAAPGSGRSASRNRLGVHGPLGRLLLFAGPAMLAATAYMDPGNVAVNIAAGARYGYALLWVVMAANVIAMLFQSLSAKLGIATGRNLAELCRERLPRPLIWPMWGLSELAAMATDLAEFVGGAVALMLLLHVSLFSAMIAVAVTTYVILLLDQARFRPLEILIAAFVAVIGVCYLIELLIAPVDWPAAANGLLVPSVPDSAAFTILVGIVGATVMPHALYLHSGLTQSRRPGQNEHERRGSQRSSNVAVIGALGIAGAINLAMVAMAGSVFQGHAEVAGIESAYRLLGPLLGAAAAGAFLVSLIASGISSSVVGTMAGQIIMQGFVGFRIPVWVRRLATMLPAFAVIGFGIDTTKALVLSQVVLSLVLPLPMIALVLFTSRRDIMGRCVNSRLTTIAAAAATAVVVAFNMLLLAETL